METAIKYYQDKLLFEIDPADLFIALEAKENIIVIDARKEFAFEKERIPVAINLPHRKMSAETTVDFDRSALYVIYCDGIGCNGSTKGALKMATLGFNVRELIGGMEWWKSDGYATEGNNKTEGAHIQCAC
jgi:rhodanese-related sulfurtransferase